MEFLTFAILVIGYLIYVSIKKLKEKNRSIPAAKVTPSSKSKPNEQPIRKNRAKTKASYRPITEDQKEFFNFFNIKVTNVTTEKDARKIVDDYIAELKIKEDPMLVEWESYDQILNELSEPESRESYNIKKLLKKLIKQALADLKSDGHTYEDILFDMHLLTD